MAVDTRRAGALTRSLLYTLFALVTIVALCPPLYNRAEPSLDGIPFFYWFQLVWIIVGAASTAVAYRAKL